MQVHQSINQCYPKQKTVVTLGTFDGVHKGHQSILEKVKESAEKLHAESLVLTFFPHPRMVLQKEDSIKLLNTIDEKADLLRQFGIEHLVIHEFNKAFANLSAEAFVKQVLVDQFKTQKIIIGYDHRFGKGRAADIHDLERFGEKYGFEVEQISAQEIDHISVSSTKIRKALAEGDMRLANDYLGYPYFFSGRVVKGKQIGRTLGFPTANFEIGETYKLIPANGIYVVVSEIHGKDVYGMMSIGTNPTLGSNPQTIEVNYLNLDEDLYGKTLKVRILEKIRDEATFDSLETLKKAIGNDRLFTLQYIDEHIK